MDEVVQLIERQGPAVALIGRAFAAESGIPLPDQDGTAVIAAGEASTARAWSAFGARLRQINTAVPGPGYRALRWFTSAGLLSGAISTSDDVLPVEAGIADVVQLSGSASFALCPECGHTEPLGCLVALLPLPPCAACGVTLRPGTRLRGEPVDQVALIAAMLLVCRTRLLIAVGTTVGESLLVGRLAHLAVANGASLVIVGGEPGSLEPLASAIVRGESAPALTILADQLR